MRGSGKINSQLQAGLAIHQMLQDLTVHGSGAMLVIGDFAELELRAIKWAKLMVEPDIVERPVFQLTDYDPRGADRIKGPKGPRTKWGKLK